MKETDLMIVLIYIASTVIAVITVSGMILLMLPPHADDTIHTKTFDSSILPPQYDRSINTYLGCADTGIIASIPNYTLHANYTYTIEFMENTSTSHPEGKWVLRMREKMGTNENILARC